MTSRQMDEKTKIKRSMSLTSGKDNKTKTNQSSLVSHPSVEILYNIVKKCFQQDRAPGHTADTEIHPDMDIQS